MEPTARDIMDAQVICIQADATVKEALEFLVAPPPPGVLYSMPPDTWLERWRCWM